MRKGRGYVEKEGRDRGGKKIRRSEKKKIGEDEELGESMSVKF